MRYKCTITIEIRGLLSKDEKKKCNTIIQKVFKHILRSESSNLTEQCTEFGVDGAEINLILTDNAGIQLYNKEYRAVNSITDVLSFPVSDFEEGRIFVDCDNINPENNYLSLGDIIISIPRMKEQAVEFGHSETRELAFLTAHAILHLLGYDHMTPEEAEIMELHCTKALEELGYTRNYIEEA